MRTPSGPCARHGCGHDAGHHADMRTPSGKQKLFRGQCQRCDCSRWLEEPACARVTPITVTTKSGRKYTRCACGAVTEIAPETAST